LQEADAAAVGPSAKAAPAIAKLQRSGSSAGGSPGPHRALVPGRPQAVRAVCMLERAVPVTRRQCRNMGLTGTGTVRERAAPNPHTRLCPESSHTRSSGWALLVCLAGGTQGGDGAAWRPASPADRSADNLCPPRFSLPLIYVKTRVSCAFYYAARFCKSRGGKNCNQVRGAHMKAVQQIVAIAVSGVENRTPTLVPARA
jgi:hypothetical protein